MLVREACLANARCRCAVCYDLVRCAAPSDVWFVDIMRLGEVARRPASVAAAQAPCRKRGAGVRPARTPPPLVGSLHATGRGQCCALEMMTGAQGCDAATSGRPARRVGVMCASTTRRHAQQACHVSPHSTPAASPSFPGRSIALAQHHGGCRPAEEESSPAARRLHASGTGLVRPQHSPASVQPRQAA